MHTELHVLRTCTEQVLANPPTGNTAMLIHNVTIACERLKYFLFLVFSQSDDLTSATEILNWYRLSVTKLANSLWYAANAGNIPASEILLLVIGLTTHIEEEYGHRLDETHALPALMHQDLSKHISLELIEIREGLTQKHISVSLIEQLAKALTDLFKPTKYPVLCYAEKKYIEIFLPRLKALALEDREKDWNRRLRQLLIKYNFNHMGVYKFLKAEGQNDANFLQHYGSQKTFLEEKKIWLDGLMLIQGLAFNPESKTLKKLLLKDIAMARRQLAKKEDRNEHSRFDPNLGVGVLNLIFRYLFQFGLPRYKSKEEAAAAFCKNIRSKEKDSISTNSILKTGLLSKENDARLLYRFLKQIMDQLKEDFKL